MQFIALEFETDVIHVAAARQSGRTAEIQQAFSISTADQSDVQVAELLKAALNKHGLARHEACVVVSRSFVEIRELNVPPAPDNELPDMVRLIARNEFASLNDNWLLDFVPLSSDPNVPRKVLASGLSPERHKQIVKLLDTVGVKLKHIVLKPLATFDLLKPALTTGKCSLIVDLGDHQTDMIISSDLNVVATRTVRTAATADDEQRHKTLLSEIKRTIASSRGALGEREISEIKIIGDSSTDELLATKLGELTGVDVAFVKPFSLVELDSKFRLPADTAAFTPLLGCLQQLSRGARHSIDYLNPRRPVVKKTDRQKLYLYGGLATAALLASIIFCWWTLRSQSLEIADLNSRLAKAQEQNKGNSRQPGVTQIMGEVGKIDSWKQLDINWLDELYEYSNRFLTPDDAIVDSFDAAVRREEPQIIVRSRMANGQIESAVVAALNSRPYAVNPSKWVDSNEDPGYTTSVDFNVSLTSDRSGVIKQIDSQATEFLKRQSASRQSELPQTELPQTELPQPAAKKL